ncbi:hypothetical protein J7J95_01910 [bacterium]|nr:hypothetical protein [bacterium]
MKKEIFLAILIGIVFGLIVMFGWEVKKKHLPSSFPSPTPTIAPSLSVTPSSQESTQEKTLFLSLDSPEDESISSQEKITLKGKTIPLATIIVISEEEENILVANENGEFESTISLSPGPNEIEVSAYDEEGKVVKKTITVTYSTAKF